MPLRDPPPFSGWFLPNLNTAVLEGTASLVLTGQQSTQAYYIGGCQAGG